MAVTLISTPAHADDSSPAIVTRWVATESQNNFRLQRKDFIVNSCASDGSSPEQTELTLAAAFTGQVGDEVAFYSAHNAAMYTGVVTSIASPATTIVVDTAWDAAFDITYLNDNTLRGGYYFEGRLTVNDVVQALTVIASPNSFGIADLDVSGILRIMVALGKTADYSTLLAAEPTKGGKFTFAYRECWYSSDEAYTEEGEDWFYVEAVRSIEQGSNLYDFVPTAAYEAPFFNAFEQPVYFVGLPFDITFLLPVLPVVSPATELSVVRKFYSATNTLLDTLTTDVALTGLEGRPVSLNIDPDFVPDAAAYMTIEILTA